MCMAQNTAQFEGNITGSAILWQRSDELLFPFYHTSKLGKCYQRSFNSPDLFEVFTLAFSVFPTATSFLGAEAGVESTAGGP